MLRVFFNWPPSIIELVTARQIYCSGQGSNIDEAKIMPSPVMTNCNFPICLFTYGRGINRVRLLGWQISFFYYCKSSSIDMALQKIQRALFISLLYWLVIVLFERMWMPSLVCIKEKLSNSYTWLHKYEDHRTTLFL